MVILTCSMLGLKSAAHKGFQWVVLVRVLLAAFIATILISAKQSLLLINSELMLGDVKRRNGNGPCSGILCPNGNLMAIVWRHTCSLISHAFKTYSSQSKKKNVTSYQQQRISSSYLIPCWPASQEVTSFKRLARWFKIYRLTLHHMPYGSYLKATTG